MSVITVCFTIRLRAIFINFPASPEYGRASPTSVALAVLRSIPLASRNLQSAFDAVPIALQAHEQQPESQDFEPIINVEQDGNSLNSSQHLDDTRKCRWNVRDGFTGAIGVTDDSYETL